MAIIGGGVAAVEAMLALDAASYSGADVHLFSPQSRFVLKPLAVPSEFGHGSLLTFDLWRVTSTAGATFHDVGVDEVDPERRAIGLSDDSEFSYDYLIASPGTESLTSVPGAINYAAQTGNQAVTEALVKLRGREDAKVVVTMPEGGTWPLPAYELALLIAAELDPAASTTIVTPEQSPLGLFGEAASEKVASLLRSHGIEVLLETSPREYRDGTFSAAGGHEIEADLTVALPHLTGRRIEGLPYDEQGFIPVDDFCRIDGHSREFAAGDVTSFPVKFGALATEQADIAAAAIAAAAWSGPPPQPFKPVYRGTLVTADGLIDLGPGVASFEPYAWDPAEKVQGKYLTAFLKAADPATLRAPD